MPYLNQYVELRDGNLASLLGFSSAQAWYTSVVRPIGINLDLELPENVDDYPAYVQQTTADCQAKIKTYETAVERRDAAANKLAEEKSRIEQLEGDLADGDAQLNDSDAQLNAFEQSEVAFMELCYQLLESMTPCIDSQTGETLALSLAEYMALELDISIPPNFVIENSTSSERESKFLLNDKAYNELCDAVFAKMYLLDVNGENVTVPGRDGFCLLDLDKYTLFLDKAEEYIAAREAANADATQYISIMLLITSVIGCLAGILLILQSVFRTKSKLLPMSFVCGAACFAFAVCTYIIEINIISKIQSASIIAIGITALLLSAFTLTLYLKSRKRKTAVEYNDDIVMT